MNIHFSQSLHYLFEKVSVPLQDLFTGLSLQLDDEHEMLWACYLTEQMSPADLETQIAADPAFAAFVKQRGNRLH